jgi:hypothetical protein
MINSLFHGDKTGLVLDSIDEYPTVIIIDDRIIEVWGSYAKNGRRKLRVVGDDDIKIIGGHRIKKYGVKNCLEYNKGPLQ